MRCSGWPRSRPARRPRRPPSAAPAGRLPSGQARPADDPLRRSHLERRGHAVLRQAARAGGGRARERERVAGDGDRQHLAGLVHERDGRAHRERDRGVRRDGERAGVGVGSRVQQQFARVGRDGGVVGA
ncbi:hypothetical protein EG878_17150, partial [Enterococcus faecalis]